jgi:hypothetical protein
METDEQRPSEVTVVFRRPVDRRRFLRTAAVVGVGASLLGVDGLAAAPAQAQTPPRTVDFLRYGLTFEYLMCDFYQRVLDADLLEGRERELVARVFDLEQSWVQQLDEAIERAGGESIDKPTFNWPAAALESRDSALAQAADLEELGVCAWQSQFPILHSDLLNLTEPILVNKSRAAAVTAALVGRNPCPAPVEEPMAIVDVLREVEDYRGAAR